MRKQTLLVIDDDKDFNDFMKISFEQNWKIRTALNGKLGISNAIIQQPDLILLDVAMPIMSGFDVYKLLKSDPISSSIPIVFLTTMDGMDKIIKSKTNRNVEVIKKHFNSTKLETQIIQAFNKFLVTAN